MKLGALAGLPRSGTTLLANILAQHRDIHVSGTSALPLCIEALQNTLSAAPEVQSDLANVPGAYNRYLSAMRGFIDGWYGDLTEPIVIDKGRGWIMNRALLTQLAPGSVMIVSVRDPRDVVASIEKQHRRTAAFNSPLARTVYESADLLMKQDGMVGGPMRFIEDLLRRNLPGVAYVRYESFVVDPDTTMKRLVAAIGCDAFHFDYLNVENTASDLDALYRNKFPHEGSGAIKPTGRTWRDTLDADLAEKIAAVCPLYMRTFGYSEAESP